MKLAHGLTHVGALLIICVNFAGVQPAHAQTKDFNLPAQPAIKGIPEFARQAGIQMLVSEKLVRGKQTAAVTGSHSIEEAVVILLQGTGLTATTRDGSTYTVVLAPPPKTGNEPIQFNIPNEDLAMALNDFSTQSGLTVAATKELTAGKKSKGVRGTMSATEALRRLLKGSGLTFVTGADGSFAVQANASEGPSQEKADTADVTVEGQQEKEKPYTGMNVDIPRTIDDVQPYYIFDSETIEKSGALNVENFLKQQLTMNTVAQTNSQVIGNGTSTTARGLQGGNTSTINLLGVGANETLVLVDGRRMAGVSFEGNTSQPDVNGLPLAAIDRIEILPSSASAIYGGSAVGGVVNIILKNNYSGGDLRATYDRPLSGDAPIRTISGAYGTSLEGGKSHVMFTAQYSDAQALEVGDRTSLINRGYSTILKNDPAFLGYDPTFSTLQLPLLGTTPNILGYDPNTSIPTNLTLKGTGASFNCPTATLPAGYSAASSNPATIIACRWNLALPNVNQGPTGLLTPLGSNTQTQSLRGNFTRQMSDSIQFFADAMYSRNKSVQEVNQVSAGSFYAFISPTSPFNPFNQNVLVAFPDNFAAPVTSTSTSYTATVGLKAELAHEWSAEMDYTWSKSIFDTATYTTDTSISPDLANGPLNPFVDTLAHPLNLGRYLVTEPVRGSSTIDDVALRAAGSIAQLPWGAPRLSIGLEHRAEKIPVNMVAVVDPLTPAIDSHSTYFPQRQSIDSLYVEGDVPLVTSKNAIPAISLIELQLADRIERYSVNAGSYSLTSFPNATPPYYYISPTPPNADANGNGGTPLSSTSTYTSNNETFGLKYKPIDDVTIRVSRGTAFLPPTPSQLLLDPVVMHNGDTITDPKTGATYQVGTLTGGNPGLTPQHSKNWDVGLIYEPREHVLEGLRFNLEYFQIAQFGYITTLSGNQILSDPALSSRVTRDPTTGLITVINERDINATEFKTEGFNLAINYHKPTAVGIFDFRIGATQIDHNKQQYYVGTPKYELAGAPIGEGGTLRRKAITSLDWAYRNWTLDWTVTYYGSYPQVGSSVDPFNPNNPQYTSAQGSDHIPSQLYHDFFASYSFSKTPPGSTGSALRSALTDGLVIQLGIKNILNTQPPFDAYYAPFYASPLGDLRLRDVWLTVKKNFH